MAKANAWKGSEKFEKHIKVSRFILKILCVDITTKPRRYSKFLQLAISLNQILTILLQIIYNITTEDEGVDELANVIYMNYIIVGLGKLLTMYYRRQTLVQVLKTLEEIYPENHTEEKYNLKNYFKYYSRLETVIWTFYRIVGPLYTTLPLLLSLMNILSIGKFTLLLPLSLWKMGNPMDNQWWLKYIFYYVIGACSCILSGLTITGCDLCLYNLITQLCMHYDLLSQRILELDPAKDEQKASKELNVLIRQHLMITDLANETNNLFGLSIIFSVMSSSFTLCLVAYQMLDDVSMLTIVKSFILLLYESKQVIITCYIGQKLKEYSSLVNESLYAHRWYDGSTKYRRCVLIMLACTSKPFVLNFIGIANISVITLKEVYGNAYRLFTVFKSA
ncbi:odorant receptor 85c-like [Musca autumnalis]|uniref:odorant receptor 85c-like n=1 Tax=Musca autumnalis TaxID=221902 RepID=UPI003CF327EE